MTIFYASLAFAATAWSIGFGVLFFQSTRTVGFLLSFPVFGAAGAFALITLDIVLNYYGLGR